MGKGYNNFMSKKPFHPASKENIKRVWMAEQRSIDLKKKEDDMRLQYEKEQDMYNNRLLVAGSDSKDKLSLNFMYEAPPGVKKESKDGIGQEVDVTEPEYKFEWQRNAPRESFAKNNMDIRDQPFGIQVRNVRCLKCHKWGHVNTDRECPLYNTASIPSVSSGSELKKENNSTIKTDPNKLIDAMKEEQGLALKKSLYSNYGPKSMNDNKLNQMLTLAVSQNPEIAFLESLSSKEKKRLLKKLQKLTSGKLTGKKSNKDKDRKKHKKRDKKDKYSSKKRENKDKKIGDRKDRTSDRKDRSSDKKKHHRKDYRKR